MTTPRQSQRPEGWYHRGPRPLMMWVAIVVGVALVGFFAVIGYAVAIVYLRAADEMRSVPDMSGGLAAILGGVAVLVPVLLQAAQVFSQRHRERMDQQTRGTAPNAPFVLPSPSGEASPTGGLVNNQAIE